PLPARAGPDARRARGRGAAQRVERCVRADARTAPAERRARRHAGHPLVARIVRLLPDVHARQPLLGAALGRVCCDGSRRPGAHPPRGVPVPARLAARERALARRHRPGRGSDPQGDRVGARPRSLHALPVDEVRAALRSGNAAVNADDPVLDMFLELAAIGSPSGSERAVADRGHGFLRDLGLQTEEGGAGEAIGSEIGNIYCRVPATAEGTSIFLNAHLDTVPPTDSIEPVVEDGVVTNSNDTILGADNKAAVVAMLGG